MWHDVVMKILAELIVISALNYLPFSRLKSIDKNIAGLRHDLHLVRRGRRQDRRRIDRHERRIDRHDDHAGINTKDA